MPSAVDGLKPGAVEDVSKRTAFMSDFANPDGSRTRRIYAQPVFAPTASGALVPIDETLGPTAAQGWLAGRNTYSSASFAPVNDGSTLARLDMGGGVSVGFGLAGSARVSATVDQSVARYAGVMPGVDVELSSTALGMKDVLVLHSPRAPTSYTFGLLTTGVTPSWDSASQTVRFTDRVGNMVASIPPGFMEDASFDVRTGAPARSDRVVYTLVRQGSGWALRMDLDKAWLADPSRVWPVRVDPPLYGDNYTTDDTYVSKTDQANRNNSADPELKIGTYNGGTEIAATYLKFDTSMPDMSSKYIYSADVSLYNEYSFSCRAANASMYAVTQTWTGPTAKTWPGPSYDPNPLYAPTSAAYGYPGCASAHRITFPFDAARAMAWSQGLEPFYGFTVRASSTNNDGWKRFWSNNHDPSVGPLIEYNYDYGPTALNSVLPAPGSTVDTLTPTLYANYFDPNTDSRQFQFQVCMGTKSAPSGCHASGWQDSPSFEVSAGWVSGWGKPWFWQVRVANAYSMSAWLGEFTATAQVPQPVVKAHLAGAPEGSEMPGVNPQPGNYATEVTDATLTVPGPPLEVARTYNSQDVRTDGLFGPGWSTPWDAKAVVEPDNTGAVSVSTGNVLVTLPSGLVVRFGRNGDGSYAPPSGTNFTLVYNGSNGFTYRDPTGFARVFTALGPVGTYRVTTVTDPDGQDQTFTYDGSVNLTTVTDAASSRVLHVGMTGGRITSVATDQPAVGQPALTWTYSYTSGYLTGVCTPLGSGSCASYTHTNSSSYRSVVLDDNPVAYWPLNETTGTTADNLAAPDPSYLRALENGGITFGASGALAGSPDPGYGLSGAAGTWIAPPPNVFNTEIGEAFEVWFKTGTGQGGVLFGEQNTPQSSTPGQYVPMLYVGTDGHLRGMVWAGTASDLMGSTSTYDDNQWHLAVLSVNGSQENLYIDGFQTGIRTGISVAHLNMVYGLIGSGYTNPTYYPGTPAGYFPFRGQLDDAAFYRHPLAASQVAAHYNAGHNAAKKLATVVEPGPFTATTLTYNHATSRVTSLVDRNGATWTLSAPTAAADGRHVTVSSNTGVSATYVYDLVHDGRMVSRNDSFGSTEWTYDAAGFVASVTDPNDNATTYGHDSRGNVTSTTTCRSAGDCRTSYAHYYLNTGNPLDARNDVQDWTADARSTSSADSTYQSIRALDAAGRTLQITYPTPSGQSAHPVETFTYTPGTPGGAPAGLLATHIARNGATTSYTYNSHGDQLSVTDPTGLVTTRTYDALGRIASTTLSSDAGGTHQDYGTTSFTYNGLSQPVNVTAPALTNSITGITHQPVTTHGYDNVGRRTSLSVADATGGDPTRSMSWVYDPAGRLTTTTNLDGAVTTQGWNTAGDIVSTTQPGGLTKSFTYDAAHHLLTATATGSGVDPANPNATSLLLESRTYDPAGRLYRITDAMGRITEYDYYWDNLLSEIVKVSPTLGYLDLELNTYDAAGNRTSVMTPGGVITRFTYDPAGNQKTKELDPTGLNRVTTNSFNADNSIHHSIVTGAASPGRSERIDYTYDPAGQLLTRTVDNTGASPAALTTTLVRDPRGLVTSSTDPTGVTTTYTYDQAGNLVDTTGAARTVWMNGSATTAQHPVTTLGRNTFGDITQRRDPAGAITYSGFDALGRPTSTTLPTYTPPGGSVIAATSTTSYNGLGLPGTQTDASGNLTTFTYNKYGDLLTRTEPDPDGAGPKIAPVTTYTYDRDHERLDTINPVGAHNQATYNDFGRQITATDTDHVAGQLVYYTTNLVYDDPGNLNATITALGYETDTDFNTANEPTKVADPTGRFTQTSYDLAGRVVSVVSGRNSTYANPVTTTSYDLAGRTTAVSQCTPNGSGGCSGVVRTTTTAYDAAGRRTQTTSAAGRPTFYSYDSAGQLAAITQRSDPANAATAISVSLGYDANGNLTHMVDGNANATDYTFNPWNLPESTIEPSTSTNPNLSDRTWTTSYNATQLSTHDTLPGGVTRSRSYDNLGRLTTETATGADHHDPHPRLRPTRPHHHRELTRGHGQLHLHRTRAARHRGRLRRHHHLHLRRRQTAHQPQRRRRQRHLRLRQRRPPHQHQRPAHRHHRDHRLRHGRTTQHHRLRHRQTQPRHHLRQPRPGRHRHHHPTRHHHIRIHHLHLRQRRPPHRQNNHRPGRRRRQHLHLRRPRPRRQLAQPRRHHHHLRLRRRLQPHHRHHSRRNPNLHLRPAQPHHCNDGRQSARRRIRVESPRHSGQRHQSRAEPHLHLRRVRTPHPGPTRRLHRHLHLRQPRPPRPTQPCQLRLPRPDQQTRQLTHRPRRSRAPPRPHRCRPVQQDQHLERATDPQRHASRCDGGRRPDHRQPRTIH